MGKRLSALLPPGPGRATRQCILHAAWGDFVGLNGSKFRRAGWWVAGARVRTLRP